MRFAAFIVRLSVTGALIAGSAVCAGWKWDRLFPL
jgi:hypothetical protein